MIDPDARHLSPALLADLFSPNPSRAAIEAYKAWAVTQRMNGNPEIKWAGILANIRMAEAKCAS